MSTPTVKVRRISLDNASKSVECTLDFCVDVASSESSYIQGMQKNFRVLVVQCTSQAQSDQLLDLPAGSLSKTVEVNAKTNFSDYKVFSVGKKQMANVQSLKESQKLQFCFSTDETGPFEVDPENMTHLSYILVPYFENAVDRTSSLGNATIEIVFDKNKKVDKAYALVDKQTGLPHDDRATSESPSPVAPGTGPAVFYAADLSAKGKATGLIKELVPIIVPNITIQDNRILDEVKIENSNFLSQDPTVAADSKIAAPYGTVEPLAKEQKEKKSYFGDIEYSKADDNEQSNRMFFSINYKKMVEDAAKFPWLLKNSNLADEMTSATKIISIKIFRTRFTETPALNSLGMPSTKDMISTEEVKHLIAESSGESGQVAAKNHQRRPAGKETFELVGSISESPSELISNTNGIRSFYVTDYEANRLSGRHQYSVEIETEDITEKYLEGRLKELNNAAFILGEYSELAQGTDPSSRKPFFSEAHRKFIPQFASHLRGRLSKENILRCLERYIATLSDLTMRNLEVNNVVPQMWPLIAPENGTVKAINRLKNNVDELVRKVEDFLKQKPITPIAGATVQTMREKSKAPKISKYVNNFEDIYFVSPNNANKRNGYKFLNIDEAVSATTPGPATIKQADYQTEIQAQHDKVFKVEGELPIAENVTVDIKALKPTYLTPVSFQDGEEAINYNTSGKDLHDPQKFNSRMIKQINNNLDNVRPMKTKSKNQKNADVYDLKENLIDLFSRKGCTIAGINSTAYLKGTQLCYSEDSEKKPEAATSNFLDSVRAPKDKTTLDREEIKKQTAAAEEKINPNEALTNIIDVFFEKKNTEWLKKGVKNSKFNLNKEKSTLNKMSVDKLSELPNQVNALMAIATNKENEKSLNIDTKKLSDQDKENTGFYYENLMNIREVKVLTGYETTDTGEVQIKKPIYKKLKEEEIRKLPAGKSAFCKTTKFDKVEADIPKIKELDAQVYNGSFVLEADSKQIATQNTISEKAEKLEQKDVVLNKEILLSTKIESTAIFTDQKFKGTSIDNKETKTTRATPRPKLGKPIVKEKKPVQSRMNTQRMAENMPAKKRPASVKVAAKKEPMRTKPAREPAKRGMKPAPRNPRGGGSRGRGGY